MTGHQQNPGTGYDLKGDAAPMIDIEAMVKACGVKNLISIDPNNLKIVQEAIEWGSNIDGPAVIITRWPCVLKNSRLRIMKSFPTAFKNGGQRRSGHMHRL